jgi:hypothetical protein
MFKTVYAGSGWVTIPVVKLQGLVGRTRDYWYLDRAGHNRNPGHSAIMATGGS